MQQYGVLLNGHPIEELIWL